VGNFEQLWYTWAETGLEGRSQLQVRAASEGLTDQRSLLARAARRLCQYELPAEKVDTNPVSFGWADFGQTRFVFRRCDAGRDGFGRPGKFFAHILAGPVHELESPWVAQRYCSPFWRSDDSTLGPSLILPQIGPGDVAPGPLVEIDKQTIVSFLTALALAQRRNRCLAIVTPHSALIGTLLAWTSDSVAGALDKLAVSTYESSSSASNYNIVGIATAQDAPERAVLLDLTTNGNSFSNDGTVERIVASLMKGGDEDTREAIAAANAGTDGQIRYEILVAAYEAMTSLRTGSPIDIDHILPAMRIPEGTRRVLGFTEGMLLIASNLVARREDVWEALELSARSLGGSDELATLGTAVGHRMWAELTGASPASSIGILERARRLSVGLTGGLATAFFADAAADPSILSRLPISERVILAKQISLVSTVAQAGTKDPVVRALLDATDSEAVEFASAPIAVELRAWAVARGLEYSLTNSTLVAVATEDSQLLIALVTILAEAGTLETIIRPLILASPASAVPVISHVATDRRLSSDDRDAIACALAQRPDLVDALGYLARFVVDRNRERSSKAPRMEVGDLLCRLVPHHVKAQQWGTEQLVPSEAIRAFAILAKLQPGTAAWNRYFVTLRMVPSGVWQNPRDRLLSSLAESILAVGVACGHAAQEAAAEYGADQLAESCRNSGDIEDLRYWLSAFIGSSVDAHSERMLRAAYRRRHSRMTSVVVLQWITWQLDVRGMNAERLRSPGFLRLARALVAAQPSLAPILDQIIERSQKSTLSILSNAFLQRSSPRRGRGGHR
jgi:hypothetical protein